MVRAEAGWLAVVGLVVLAGCLAGGGAGSDGPNTAGEATAGTSTATTAGASTETRASAGTATPTTTTDGDPAGTTDDGTASTTTSTTVTTTATTTTTVDGGPAGPGSPAWLNRSGVSERALLDRHLTALGNASSYTVTWAISGERTLWTRTRARTDPGRAYMVSRETGANETVVERYVTSDTVYVRRVSGGGDPRYDEQPLYQKFSDYYRYGGVGLDAVGPLLGFDLEYRRTVVRNGSTYYRLTADEFRSDAVGVPGSATNPSATVLVDRRGVVRELDYEYDLESGTTRSVEFQATGIGSTPVTEPGWLDEAKNETGE